MKVLHTSDWHLGVRLGRHERHVDHLAALKALIELAEEQMPDLILHSGDLFDSQRPSYVALETGVKALRRLTAVAPTVVLAGNHDSPHLLRILNDLAALSGDVRLQIVTAPRVVTVDGLDDVAVACVPFLPPSAMTDLARVDIAKIEGTYADKVRALNSQLLDEASDAAGSGGMVLYSAHLHVHGARPGRSEKRITVGDDYATHVQGLHRALYAAFGHIHDPQLLPGGASNGRYAGSLIPIDFGETNQVKHTVVVDLADGNPTSTTHDLPGGRPLRQFSGTVEEFDTAAVAGEFDGCLLKARVESVDPVPGLADRLAEVSEECTVFDLVNVVTSRPVKPVSGKADADEPSATELFGEWRATATRNAPDAEVLAAFTTLLEDPADARGKLGVAPLITAATGALEAVRSGASPATGATATAAIPATAPDDGADGAADEAPSAADAGDAHDEGA